MTNILPHDALYYPRVEAANKIIDYFGISEVNIRTFTSPTRFGKTQFILRDIVPNAQTKGYYTFYYDFKITRRLTKNNLFDSFVQFIKTLNPGFTINDESSANSESVMQCCLDEVSNQSKPTIIILDSLEGQISGEEFNCFSNVLTKYLTEQKDKIYLILINNDERELSTLFEYRQGVFQQFLSIPIVLESLDINYINFLSLIYTQKVGRSLDNEQLYRYFQRFAYKPGYIRSMIIELIVNPGLHLEEAYQSALRQFVTIEELLDFSSLPLIEQLLLKDLSEGYDSFFTAIALQKYSQITQDIVTPSMIQSKLKKLSNKGFIEKNENGKYCLKNLIIFD